MNIEQEFKDWFLMQSKLPYRSKEEIAYSAWREATYKALEVNQSLMKTLESIANNSCCTSCQEAAKVAAKALREI